MNYLQQWINDPNRDYTSGVALFALYSPNKILVRYFQTGTARFRMAKLVYEMGKLAKTAAAKSVSQPQRNVIAPIVETHGRASLHHTQSVIPDFILAAKKEISSLYSLIDKRHKELYDLGTSNADDVVRKRKKILDDRKPAIERADRLYLLKEEWFALEDGPGRKKIEGDIMELLSESKIGGGGFAFVFDSQKQEIRQTELDAGMSDIQLAKSRASLRSSITKTQNMLQYQSIRKASSPTPMPSGPKRDEYEKKLATLKALLKSVCDEMERRQIL
jgi:hypothetical protein